MPSTVCAFGFVSSVGATYKAANDGNRTMAANSGERWESNNGGEQWRRTFIDFSLSTKFKSDKVSE